jgi:hypothetical protein
MNTHLINVNYACVSLKEDNGLRKNGKIYSKKGCLPSGFRSLRRPRLVSCSYPEGFEVTEVFKFFLVIWFYGFPCLKYPVLGYAPPLEEWCIFIATTGVCLKRYI